ncbi:MAG: hypothetical protein Q9163_006400, partial [Psora crenata]
MVGCAGVGPLGMVVQIPARGDIVILVVADDGLGVAEAQAALHGFEELADGAAVGGDFHLDALVGVQVDDGESVAGFVEDVLADVVGALASFGAEGFAPAIDLIRLGALGAMGSMSGEGSHDEQFIVVGETR